ncbi:hypothetical protein GCM10010358_62030 [Streptomyces minutiscleroticus]|uniref:DUF4291 domain-containing protein n=1 Tax=Streptomyces minutiscleroticus TaxID=68238 RepID=A0A918NW82_9ACTN|nr:hypothetical protein GCM10010358_62030 [Streptomyces minutiscleroticus]
MPEEHAVPDGRAVDPESEPEFRVRARHTASTITVYQAYPPEIGVPAARDGRFPSAWKRDRMTWIKPSFLWMMYRCGWGTKQGQETVLAVEIDRDGFAWALRHACLSHHVPALHGDRDAWRRELRRAPARVQWDPERDLRLAPLPYRSLQLGLSGEAAARYADEWIVGVTDVTAAAAGIHRLVRAGELDRARALLPHEPPYPADEDALARLRS